MTVCVGKAVAISFLATWLLAAGQPAASQTSANTTVAEDSTAALRHKKIRRLFERYPDGNIPQSELDRLPAHLRNKATRLLSEQLSRDTFNRDKSYSNVRRQTGAAPTDSELNETAAIDIRKIKNRKLKRLFEQHPNGIIPAQKTAKLPESLRRRLELILNDGSFWFDGKPPRPGPGEGLFKPGQADVPNLVVPPALTTQPDSALDFSAAISLDSPIFDGYVLSHEHPTAGMAFGGNYAFAGAAGNYINGIMEKGYTVPCSGCSLGNACDHGEIKGSFTGASGELGIDIGDHSPFHGPHQTSFSHMRYSTEWTRHAAKPGRSAEKPGMKILVAYAIENQAMCENLFYANKGNGGPGFSSSSNDGYACADGDTRSSLSRQISSLKAWADRNHTWMEVAYSAADTKRIVAKGKLAVILGIESDYAWGAENRTFDVVDRLNEYYQMGVRTFYLSHKVNSRLAGADMYSSEEEVAGRSIRAVQAIANCFYVDDHIGKVNWRSPNGNKEFCNRSGCELNGFKAPEIFAGCRKKYSDISEATMSDLIQPPSLMSAFQTSDFYSNGFEQYPLPPGFDGSAGTRMDTEYYPTSGRAVTMERNNLGLSRDGKRVVREAMRKGMIITIDHLSEIGREAMYQIASEEFDGYPLNAMHNNPNDMIISTGSGTHPHEYDMDPIDIERIKETGGFFGVRLGPLDAADYPASGVTGNCSKTSTESAKILAYLIDKGLSVGYSLDFATVAQGIQSRTSMAITCNSVPQYAVSAANDHLHRYNGKLAGGISHIGVMKNFHAELKEIGLKKRYRTQLEKGGVRGFIRMWERSEQKSGVCQTNTDCSKGLVCRNASGMIANPAVGSNAAANTGKVCLPPISGAGSLGISLSK